MKRMLSVIAILVLAGRDTASAQSQEQKPPAQPAQEEPQQEETEKKDPSELTYAETVVVTASKVEQQLINAPAAVSVVTSEVIENSPAQNYGDLLRAVPGLNVAQTSARDINIVTRGASSTLATSQLALLDGRSIYQDFFGFVAWDFLPIDTSEISQIEVIRGPASAVWGANAMTGVVNVITKTPRELDSTTLTLGYGGVDRSVPGNTLPTGEIFNVHLTHAQALDDRWAYKVSAGAFGMDAFARPTGAVPVTLDPKRGPTGGGDYPAFPNADTMQPKVDARVDYDFPDGRQKLIVAGGYAGTQGTIHSGIGPFNILEGTALVYGKVNYERDTWRVNFFANLLDGEAPALLAVGLDGQPITFLFDNKTYDVEVSNSSVIGTRHILTYGGNFRYNSFDLSIAPLGDNRTEGGFYFQDEIFLSERFRWLVGARADAFSVLDKFVVSPRTTFMFKPTSEHAFRVSLNRAYRAPSFVNSFLDVTILERVNLGAINPALGDFYFPVHALGNQELDEESMTSFEIGYTGTLADRFTLSAAWYLNETSDGINFVASSAYSSRNPPPGWPLPPAVLDLLAARGLVLPSGFTYLNLGRVRDTGVELGLDARLSDTLGFFTNYSWQAEPDPENPDDFGELNIPPTNRFNLGLNGSRGRFFGSLSFNYTDTAFWTDVLDARYHGPTDVYSTINVTLGARFAEDRITASVRCANLANTDAQQHVFGDITRRQLVAELRYRFR
jgi:iron complex outermembrane receptor protein